PSSTLFPYTTLFRSDEQWGQATRAVDFFDVKADLEALFAPRSVRFEKSEHPALHPGRSATVVLDGSTVGFIGELHPRWLQKYDRSEEHTSELQSLAY